MATALTLPEASTVAISGLSLLQVTFLFVASVGNTVAASASLLPFSSEMSVLSSVTPVTATVAAFTTILQVAVFPPSLVVTVMVASPAFMAFTFPLSLTPATSGALLVQVMDLSVALDGVTVAVRVVVSPSTIEISVLSRLMPVTLTSFGFSGSSGSLPWQPVKTTARAIIANNVFFISSRFMIFLHSPGGYRSGFQGIVQI